MEVVGGKFYQCWCCAFSWKVGRAELGREGAEQDETGGGLLHHILTFMSGHMAQHRGPHDYSSKRASTDSRRLIGSPAPLTLREGDNQGASDTCLAPEGCSGGHLATNVAPVPGLFRIGMKVIFPQTVDEALQCKSSRRSSNLDPALVLSSFWFQPGTCLV